MTWDKKGNVKTIMVKGKEYQVVSQIFGSHALRGQMTQCWDVQHDSVNYIINDSWIDTEHQQNEINTLEKLCSINGILTLVAGEDVPVGKGKVDCTLTQPDDGDSLETRVHCRLLMMPVG